MSFETLSTDTWRVGFLKLRVSQQSKLDNFYGLC